jgi:hypothetical protein
MQQQRITRDNVTWMVKCTRRCRSSVSKYVFPTEDDIAQYLAEEIVCVLHYPKCVRGVNHFPIIQDFSPFLFGLH